MAKTKIGKVGMTPKGAYSNEKNYVRLDVVTENGSSYVCLKDCVGKDLTDTEYWQLVAEKGDKGDKPVNGTDYNTDTEKTEFKNEVVTETKTDIADYVTEQKTELNTYTETKKSELDEYESTKETELNTKSTELTNAFNTNATSKTKDYNDNATAKTTAFDNNATEKTNTYNDNATAKLEEYNTNATQKFEEYNENATSKVNEFNSNVDSIESELTELAKQMPWSTTEKSDSIHIEDSAKYSRNKLNLFGNMTQETSETGNNIFNGIMEIGGIDIASGQNIVRTDMVRCKDYINISDLTALRVIRNDAYEGSDFNVDFRFYDKDKNFIIYKTSKLGAVIKLSSYTDLGDYQYIRFVVTNTTDIQTYKYGLNKDASSNFEDYIPTKPSIDYLSMPQTATGVQKITRTGKNYWSAKFNFEESGLKVTTDSSGLITVNGTPTQNITKHFIANKKIRYGKYIISVDRNLSNYKMLITIRNKENFLPFLNGLQTLSGVKTNVNITNTMYYQSIIFYEGYTYNNVQFRIQLEEGDSATEFEPYQEEIFNLDLGNTELCKLVDDNENVIAQDGIVYRENKWQFKKNVEKIILNGTGNWTVTQTGTDNWFYLFYNIFNKKLLTYNEGNKYAKCNCLKANDIFTSNTKNGFFLSSNDGTHSYPFIRIRYGTEDTIENFKKCLSENNIVVYCILYESEYVDCTETQSEVLDKLYKLSLQQGVNNIFVESENGVTTELQLEYMQDLNSKLNQLESMIVANASEEVTE